MNIMTRSLNLRMKNKKISKALLKIEIKISTLINALVVTQCPSMISTISQRRMALLLNRVALSSTFMKIILLDKVLQPMARYTQLEKPRPGVRCRMNRYMIICPDLYFLIKACLARWSHLGTVCSLRAIPVVILKSSMFRALISTTRRI